jgi:hypothetical protein
VVEAQITECDALYRAALHKIHQSSATPSQKKKKKKKLPWLIKLIGKMQ